MLSAAIAQLVEHFIRNEKVVGSSPTRGSNRDGENAIPNLLYSSQTRSLRGDYAGRCGCRTAGRLPGKCPLFPLYWPFVIHLYRAFGRCITKLYHAPISTGGRPRAAMDIDEKIGRIIENSMNTTDFSVSEMRLELTRPNGHYPLKVARLPIPPSGQFPSLEMSKDDWSNKVIMIMRAKNGTRTRDPNLGKVVLYQLSYFRIGFFRCNSPLKRWTEFHCTL